MPSPDPQTFLERPLPSKLRLLLILLCALIPSLYLIGEFAYRPDLTPVILFGEIFQPKELPALKRLHPVVNPIYGYDGQFYAQMAIDPTLRDPAMARALDNLGVRGQRILLPVLAHLLGLGQPRAIIFIYALLNFGFWWLLLAFLVRKLPAATPRSFLVLYAIMLSTGTLISIERALTDLPAATFGFIGLEGGELSAALFITLAILTKPSAGLFLLRFVHPLPRALTDWMRKAGCILLALALPILWQLYLSHIWNAKPIDSGLFQMPFTAWAHRLVFNWQALCQTPFPGRILLWAWKFFEFLALVSIMVQALFILLRPQWRNPVWLVGAGFTLLLFSLADQCYTDEDGYTRIVLPLTIAFNLLLMDVCSPRLFLLLLIAGNIGLLECVGELLILARNPAFQL